MGQCDSCGRLLCPFRVLCLLLALSDACLALLCANFSLERMSCSGLTCAQHWCELVARSDDQLRERERTVQEVLLQVHFPKAFCVHLAVSARQGMLFQLSERSERQTIVPDALQLAAPCFLPHIDLGLNLLSTLRTACCSALQCAATAATCLQTQLAWVCTVTVDL